VFNFQTVSAFDKHYHHLGVLVEAMLASRDRQLEELLIRTWYLSRFPKTRMPVIKEVAAFAADVARIQETLHAAP